MKPNDKKKPPENKLEDIAIDLIANGSVTDRLRFWWCTYYKRPFLDPLFEQYTLDQLIIEYYATKYLSDPKMLNERNKVKEAQAKGTYLDDDEWMEQQLKNQVIKKNDSLKKRDDQVEKVEINDVKDIDIEF